MQLREDGGVKVKEKFELWMYFPPHSSLSTGSNKRCGGARNSRNSGVVHMKSGFAHSVTKYTQSQRCSETIDQLVFGIMATGRSLTLYACPGNPRI